MSSSWNADYSTTYLLPKAVDDWISRDHPVRFVRSFVERFAEASWKLPRDTGGAGRPAYDGEVLLKIWIFAYSRGIYSSRAAERACREWLPMIWLAGQLEPDHNTLWRFWSQNEETIGQLFENTIEMGQELGLVGLDLHAVDGTKIHASGSTHAVCSKDDLERRRERIRERRREIERLIEEQHEAEKDQPEAGRLSEELQDRKKLEEWIDRAIANADPTRRENPSEKTAVVLKNCGLGYNAQTVVDATAGLIVEQNVVAAANDQEQLVPMLDRVNERFGRTATETVADGGYNTQKMLAEAEQKEYGVIVGTAAHEPNNSQDKPYHASRFTHDAERDIVVCPERRELTYRYTATRKGGPVRVYRGRECGSCPVRDLCTKDRKGRAFDLWPHHGAVVRQRKKRDDPAARRLYARRLPLAERPFATIKTNLRFTRFKSRGIAKAALEWKFVCGIFNLSRLFALLPATA
jgi:transposase